MTDISTVDAGPLLPAQGSGRPSYQIEIEHLTKRYGRRAVVDDLTFTVQPGRVTGFLGPNGSGKSTTMKILLGLASATEGKATIGGQFYRDLRDPAGTVGVLIEQDSFHPGRSGRDHLQILSDVAGVGAARVSEILSLVGLKGDDARRHVGTYSLGMRQRLSLAAALLCDPPVLVLDEPGNGLDPQGVRTLRNLLRARAANGDTVLVSSHALAEAEHLVDDLVVIDQGRLVTTGSMHDLRQAASLVRTTSPTQLRDILETAGAVATRSSSADCRSTRSGNEHLQLESWCTNCRHMQAPWRTCSWPGPVAELPTRPCPAGTRSCTCDVETTHPG